MTALDEVYLSLGASFIPEELTGNPRAALGVAAQAARHLEPGADGLGQAQTRLAIGFAALARGNVTAARRLFERVARDTPAESAEALMARLAGLFAAYAGYAFLPGGGSNLLLTEPAWRLNVLQMTKTLDPARMGEARTEIWWPPLVTLLGEVLPWRRGVLGPEYQTGRMVKPDSAERIAVGVRQACDRLAARATAASWPALTAFAHRTVAELALRLGDPAAPALLQTAADAYLAAGFAAGQAACVLQAAEWMLAPLSGSIALDTAVMESAEGDCALPPNYEAMEMRRLDAGPDPAAGLAEQAAGIFTAIGSERGLAAVALHRSYAAFCRGAFTEQRTHAGEAERHATAVADVPLARAAAVHRIVADIGAGALGGHDAAAEAIGRWGRRSGSFTQALGLGLVLTRLARFWLVRRSDYDRASTLLSCAGQLFTGLGATQNALQCRAETARVQASLGLRTVSQAVMRATVEAYLDDAGRRPGVAEMSQRRARDLTGTLLGQAIGSADPDACLAAAGLAERVLAAAGPKPPESPDQLLAQNRGAEFERALYVTQLSRSIPQVRYSAHLLAARAARAEGDLDTYNAEIQAALEIAAAMPFPSSAFHQATVLGLARRYREAEAAYTRYLRGGGHDAQMADLIEPMRRFAAAGSATLEARTHANDRDAAAFFAHIRRFRRAASHLAAVERIAGPTWWEREDPPWAARALTGEIAEGLGNRRAALSAYDEALSMIEADLRRLLRDDQRTAFADRRDARGVYLASARAAYARGSGSDADAFDRAERGRARALSMLVAGTDSDRQLPAEDLALIRRWRETAARADALTSAEALTNAPGSSPLAREAAEVRQALAILDDKVRNRQAVLMPVLNPSADPVTADQLSSLLPSGTLLLSWVQVDGDLMTFALPAGRAPRCHRRTVDADDFTALLNRLARACREGTPWQEAAASVARLLIGPFSAEVRDAEALVVVPFMAGHRIPFHLLPFGGKAVGADRTVSSLPATGIVRHLTAKRPAGLSAAARLVVGDPAAMAWTPPGGGPAQRYDPLRFAETEARTVARPGDVCLVGADATKGRVVPEISRHGILHFATHAHVAAGAAQLSAVLLADGQVLSVADMLGTGIAADLVVLSACDTGTGSLTDGDEVVGLTRGLFAAGAHQAVVSLWPVNDLSTCLLMRRLYRKLADVTVAEALRQARGELARMDQDQQVDELLALQDELAGREAPQPVLEAVGRAAATHRGDGPGAELADFRHPHFWAPFIHVGIP
jgi:CHAT domain-containing protein